MRMMMNIIINGTLMKKKIIFIRHFNNDINALELAVVDVAGVHLGWGLVFRLGWVAVGHGNCWVFDCEVAGFWGDRWEEVCLEVGDGC